MIIINYSSVMSENNVKMKTDIFSKFGFQIASKMTPVFDFAQNNFNPPF